MTEMEPTWREHHCRVKTIVGRDCPSRVRFVLLVSCSLSLSRRDQSDVTFFFSRVFPFALGSSTPCRPLHVSFSSTLCRCLPEDEKGLDEKVLAVPDKDPRYSYFI